VHRQHQTDLNAALENNTPVNYDYQGGEKVLVRHTSIFCKAESPYGKESSTIPTVHTHGTIRIQCGTTLERLNVRRVNSTLKKGKIDDKLLKLIILFTLKQLLH
jgi:hypothetical protein